MAGSCELNASQDAPAAGAGAGDTPVAGDKGTRCPVHPADPVPPQPGGGEDVQICAWGWMLRVKNPQKGLFFRGGR